MLEDDLAECRDVIFAIISMENRGEGLPGPFGQIVLPGSD